MRLFIQGENVKGVQIIEIDEVTKVRDLLPKIAQFGFPVEEREMEGLWIGVEDRDEPLSLDERVDFEEGEDVRLHVNRNHRISVTCMFNGQSHSKAFSPSATVQSVKAWACGPDAFNLSPIDAADHVLQVCGGEVRPSDSVHIGTLVQHPQHELCFQLVPADRHQG